MLRNLPKVLLLVAGLAACGAPEPEPAPAPEPEVPARTADPFKRGLTEADFPRVQELAPGVYSYEQLRAAGEELFTTVSMFVVTGEGVLVADGQGSFEETARMVEEIGKSPTSRSPTSWSVRTTGTTRRGTRRSRRGSSSSCTRTRWRRWRGSASGLRRSRCPER